MQSLATASAEPAASSRLASDLWRAHTAVREPSKVARVTRAGLSCKSLYFSSFLCAACLHNYCASKCVDSLVSADCGAPIERRCACASKDVARRDLDMSAQSVSARATYHTHAQVCLNSAPITPDSIAQLDGAPGALHVGDSEISGAHAACACLDEPAR